MNKITMEFARQDDCLDRMVPSDLRLLTGERDALAAQVEALQSEIVGLVSTVFKTSKALIEATETIERELLPALEDSEPLIELIGEFKAVVAATPQQHLAEIRAEAVRAAANSCLFMASINTDDGVVNREICLFEDLEQYASLAKDGDV